MAVVEAANLSLMPSLVLIIGPEKPHKFLPIRWGASWQSLAVYVGC